MRKLQKDIISFDGTGGFGDKAAPHGGCAAAKRITFCNIAIVFFLSSLLLFAAGCGKGNGSSGHSAEKATDAKERALEQHLADYWLTAPRTEQGVVDFLYIAAHATPQIRARSWQRMAATVGADSLVAATITDYLGNPDSPMRNEEMLLEALQALIPQFPDGAYMRTVMEDKQHLFSLNPRGRKVHDLHLRLADGAPTTLLDLTRAVCLKTGDNATVLFYDGECDNCEALIREMSGQPDVVAVSVRGGVKRLPDTWHSAVADADEIDSLYYLPLLPEVYVLDSGGARR